MSDIHYLLTSCASFALNKIQPFEQYNLHNHSQVV